MTAHPAVPVRPHRLLDPCGKFLPALLYHDLRDRMRGQRERARARWGKVARPSAPGKLIWIAAGATRASVRLAVEIAHAILARRHDLGVTLTFETEYADLITGIESNPRIACCHAPADYAGSMHAVWRRLMPFGVILAGVLPRPNLIRLSEACGHSLLVAPPGLVPGRYERIYPGHRQIYDGRNVAAACDLDILLRPAAEPDDTRLADIAVGRTTCLWYGSDEEAVKRIYALFRGHLPHGILLASGPVTAKLARHSAQTITLSAWAEQPVPPDKLVLVDEPSALRGLMPNVTAAHFARHDDACLWLALSAGVCVSSPEIESIASPSARLELRRITNENTLIDYWRSFDADAALRAQAAASARQAYATEYALAQRGVNDLLTRVCAWQ